MPVEANSTSKSESISSRELTSAANNSKHPVTQNCANCGASAEKSYCPECGQSTHLHHSLLHLIEELLHGLLHFDTKAWRTIPALMLQPGKLTRHYIDGQRTKYVSPLALFLFLIFVMFFVFSFTSSQFQSKPLVDEINSGLQTSIKEQREQLLVSQQSLSKMAANDPARAALEQKIAEDKEEIASTEKILNKTEATGGTGRPAVNDHSPEKVRYNLEKNVPMLATPFIINGVSHALQNPELILYKFKNTLSKLAFLLVPISLPFLWLLFALRRQHTMFEHAVFSLYSLSFMSILMMLCSLLAAINWYGISTTLLICIPPIHIYRHLRDTYQLSGLSTLWRTVALLFVAFFSLLIFALIALRFSV